MALGITLNNPGNIRRSADKWQGLAPVQPNPSFFAFTDPVFGIRAMAVILIHYQDKYGVHTIFDAISKWAPPSDNNPTTIYAQNVARAAGLDTKGIINFHDYRYLRGIIEAMIRQEQGVQPYSPAQIDKGLAMAGILPPQKPLIASGTINASTVGVAGGGITAATGLISQVAPNVYYLQPVLDMVRDHGATLAIVGGIGLVALFGYIVYRRWDDRRRLAR